MKSLIGTGIVCCFLLTTSCTTFREHHYFKDELDDDFSNYYRVKVSGHTRFMSKTRYYSGYFPSSAIDVYFNEFTQSRDGRLLDSTQIRSLSGANHGKQLVMILSSNADDIANQIGNVTQTRNTLNAVMSLTNGDALQVFLTQQSQLETAKADARILVEVGESLLGGIETKPPLQARMAVLQYINVLASSLGHPESFKSFDAAKAWFDQGSFINLADN